MMILSKKGAAFIRAHEGFRSKAYRDPVGIPTIGIGFTWRSAAFRSWWNLWKAKPFDMNATMTEAEADDALQFIVMREYGKAVDDFLNGQKVPQHVYDAMVSAVFNLGPGALKWKWAQAIKAGDFDLAARHLINTGTTAKGKRLPGLVRRRKEEALLLQRGVYTGVRIATAVPSKPVHAFQSPAPATPAQGFWARLKSWLKGK